MDLQVMQPSRNTQILLVSMNHISLNSLANLKQVHVKMR
ncbi:UNVERIFIED_CONTAM: hypothetical protein GTU68_011035 [Idotea baltica]|nr:hypothetical protein [Idotea baltica]